MITSHSDDDDRDVGYENSILRQEMEYLVAQYGESRRNECAAVAELQRVADQHEQRAAQLRRKAAGLEHTLITHCNPTLTKNNVKNVNNKNDAKSINSVNKPPPITTACLANCSPYCLDLNCCSVSVNDPLCSPMLSSASTVTTPVDTPSFLSLLSFPRLKQTLQRTLNASNSAVVSPVITVRKMAGRLVSPTSPMLPAASSPTTQSSRFATVDDNNIMIRRELSSHSNTSKSSTETVAASTDTVNTSVITKPFSPDSTAASILDSPATVTSWSKVPSISFVKSVQSLFRNDCRNSSMPPTQMQQQLPKLRRVRELGSSREFRIRELGRASNELEIGEFAGTDSSVKKVRVLNSVTSTLHPKSGISETVVEANGTNLSSSDSQRGSRISWVSVREDMVGGWSGQTLAAFQRQQQRKQQLEQQQKQLLLQLELSRYNTSHFIDSQDWFEPVASSFVEETFSAECEMKQQSGVTGESTNNGLVTTEQVLSGTYHDGNNFNQYAQKLTKRPSFLTRIVKKLKEGTPTFMTTDVGAWR
ncbi:hypothetical protein HK100_004468 [Physocladia obscura]|uniref:Uncharacterized protein n=1 Tax=Physocladia obscura TaxID=109957 RepID=A0AAD5TAM8_9FUNG|nr:hypothetical protein HK100_004468 [Physocladia obscura]